MIQLQTEFLRNQFGIATEQSHQMGGGIASRRGKILRKKSLILILTTHADARLMATVIEAIAFA